MHWWQKATSSWGPSPGSTATVDFSTLLAIRPSLSVVVRNCAHAARQAAHWRHDDGHRSGAGRSWNGSYAGAPVCSGSDELPRLVDRSARSAGWCSGNPGWWRGGQRRRSISGIGMARAKIVRHLRRHECHRGGAGDSCGGGQRAKQAESEAPQPAWHVGGRAGSDSLSVNPRVPCAGATGKEGGSIAVNDRRPVDHLVLVLAGERLAAI